MHAFLWTPTVGMVDLGTLGGVNSEATAINNAGQVVGWGEIALASDRRHAFVWNEMQGLVDLGTFPGGDFSVAADVNNAGQVVGFSNGGTGLFAFLWAPATGMVSLGRFASYTLLSADGINDAGYVVGQSLGVQGDNPAFLWSEAGGAVFLGTLGGGASNAAAINRLGHVAGASYTASGARRGFLWTPAVGMINLGTLGGDYSQADDINDASQIVGRAVRADGEFRAFLWTAASGMSDLGKLDGGPGAGSLANGINNQGWVVGGSWTASGFHATLWRRCAPAIQNVAVSPDVLWPPNHQMVTVRVTYTVTSSCAPMASATLSVVSSEADNGSGDGNFPGDMVVLDAHTLLLRAERSGRGDGRTYTIGIQATDSEGRVATNAVTVTVPKNGRGR
jgi:probable HAF family extracellular repeat protein